MFVKSMVYVCVLQVCDEYGLICYRFMTSMVCMLQVYDEYGLYVACL